MYTTLIDSADLQPHTGDANWIIVDCRFELANPAAGEALYAQSHIPGAVYAHLDRDLSARKGAGAINGGRHPLPSRELAATQLSALGISDGMQVVAYDAAGGMFASRLWWMLRWIGHEAVAVLDGGLPAWIAAGLPVIADRCARAAGHLSLASTRVQLVDAAHVLHNLDTVESVVLDARAPDRYDGSAETVDPVHGHIPAAVNLPFAGNLDATGRFRPVADLRARISLAAGGKPVIHQCGSGVTACHNLLAATHAGLPAGALYAGSWSEWIEDPSRPRWTPA